MPLNHTINFIPAGGVNDGITANDEAFKRLIDTVRTPVIIYFPKGNYYFTKPVVLPQNVSIQGISYDSTLLTFKLDTPDALIKIIGNTTNISSPILSGLYKDNQTITVSDPQVFSIGDHAIIQENDSALITSSWAKKSTGQIVKIDSIISGGLHLASPLRRSYIGGNAKIVKLAMVQNVAIENLKIKRLDTTTEQSSNILFEYATNCVVKCIESQNCNFAHIELDNSTNIDVSGCYIHNAFLYGDDGEGYGVVAQYTTGECLITDNIFDSLRHPMLMQAGSNGNVFSYNYAIHPIWVEAGYPVDAAGSIVLHGNYPYANLMEGNVVQNVAVDNSHGENGPYNTFYRTRAELYGIVMSLNAGDSENFVGNEITGTGFLKGIFEIIGTNEFEFGNNQNGTIIPAGTSSIKDSSLYLPAPPPYYLANASWPPIGPPNAINKHIIAAEDRYVKRFFTSCSVPSTTKDTSKTMVFTAAKEGLNISVFPNPTTDIAYLSFQNNSTQLHTAEVTVLSTLGKVLFNVHNNIEVNLGTLPEGMYFLKIRSSNNNETTIKVIKQNQ